MRDFLEIYKKYIRWISSPIFAILLSLVLHYVSNINYLFSLILILISFFIPVIIILIKELQIKSNQLKNIRGIERDMIVSVRILNSRGDKQIQSKIRITNKDQYPVEFLYKDIYSTPGKKLKLYKPKILSSSINNITIEERVKNYFIKEIKLDSVESMYNYVECDYRISPPLRKINDFIEYELVVDMKKDCKTDGDENIDGFIVKNIASYIEMNLIALKKTKIVLIDYWVEDLQANRIEYLKSIIIAPQLVSNGNLIKWFIEYPRMNYLYLFKYKLIKI